MSGIYKYEECFVTPESAITTRFPLLIKLWGKFKWDFMWFNVGYAY